MTAEPGTGVFAGNRARAGASFLAVSVILGATSVSVSLALHVIASPDWEAIVRVIADAVKFVAVWAALPLGLALLLAAGSPRRWRVWTAMLVAIAAPFAVQLTGAADSAFLILLALAAAVGGYALIALGIVEHRVDPPRPDRVLAAVAVLVAAELAVVALGLLHLLVWNPMATVPQLSLSQIYDGIQESQGIVDASPAAWAIGAILATVAGGVFAVRGSRRGIVTPHQVVTGGLLLLHATSFFLWWAGFGLGLSLARTFAAPTGDASPVGALLALLGAVCLAAAVLLQLHPPRDSAEEAQDDGRRAEDAADDASDDGSVDGPVNGSTGAQAPVTP